ncbi:DHH family phosphoesterase [Candidatus Woesearchaeota archaeon]|nr:DHH family phosphoesterase [Candidatus Woesearchaeota archaeon]
MALSKTQIAQIRDNLDNCKKPLFFFDDDQDGLCSFLQLYRYKKEGKGIIVKTTPKLGTSFVGKVHEYSPDKVFILDLAVVEQDFLDEMKVPVIWIDHHGPFERNNVKYFNPRIANWEDNHPTSYMCHQVVQQELKASDASHSSYLWIAAIGCVADWFIPPFINEFKKEFPELIEKPYKYPGDIIYNSKLGHLIRIFSFVLKGKTNDVLKCIKILTRIESPYEILNQETAQGKFIYKRYEQVNKMYEPLIDDVIKTAEKTEDKLVVFNYKDDKTSFTSDLSNEAIYRFPDKIILIAREKNDEMKCSLRSSKIILPILIEKALVGLEGYGGGHEHACGLNVKSHQFEEFVKRLREMV